MEEKRPKASAKKEPNEWRKYARYSAIVLGALACIVLLFDYVVMPWYVGLGNFVRIPNVINEDVADATRSIEAQGLYVQVSGDYYHNSIPKGRVISQLPFPSSQVKSGRRVYLTVSKGRESLLMPNLVSLSLREARIQLIRLGIDLADVRYAHNDSIRINTIMAQSIPSKTPIASNQKVDVTVSLGPELVYILMPDLVGLPLETAEQRLLEANLILGAIATNPNETFLPNTVIAQTPQAGDSVAMGARINISISR